MQDDKLTKINPKRLLVILSDPLTPLLEKGEVTARYYNPGDVFSEVHILLLNDDKPDASALKYMVGEARVFIHNFNLPSKISVKSFGWQTPLLERFLQRVLPVIQDIAPDILRTHGLSLELLVARMSKRRFGIPHVASIHTNPHQPAQNVSLVRRFFVSGLDRLRSQVLKEADEVLPVYEPAVPFLQSLGVSDFQVCYNVLNPSAIKRKADYKLNKTVKVVCVSRQFQTKDPSNLIRAVAVIENMHLTLIGDGELHEALARLVNDLDINDRVEFIPSIENGDLCRLLSEFDFFAVHSDHWEVSKAVLEALLSGLPVIINKLPDYQIPELSEDLCVLVENSEEGYLGALKQLIEDDNKREEIGRNAARVAWERWDPQKSEAAYQDIYKGLLGG